MKLLLLSVTLLCAGPTATSADCPTNCRCTHFSFGLYDSVQCANMSLTQLPFGNLDDILGKLDLSYNEFTIITNHMFLLRKIDFLDKLLLNNNKITTIEVHAFVGLSHLTYINLGHNNITNIDSQVFQSNSRLQTLKLQNNCNLQLPETGFYLPQLSILDLSKCGLSSIPDNFFVSMTSLDILSLYGNQLANLDSTLVAPLRQLEYLDLRYNKFTQLSQKLLQLPETIDIDFGGNLFHCDCELQKMYLIYKRRVHNDMLLCRRLVKPRLVELTEPSKLPCHNLLPLNGTLSLHGSSFAIICILLQVVLNNFL